MSFRASLRPLSLAGRSAAAARTALLPAFTTTTRSFHSTRPAFVRVGDEVPNLEVLCEDSPGNKVNLAQELAAAGGRGLIIGVPAAFSPACSAKHVPSYMTHPRAKDAGPVFVVSVNDAFVYACPFVPGDPEEVLHVLSCRMLMCVTVA